MNVATPVEKALIGLLQSCDDLGLVPVGPVSPAALGNSHHPISGFSYCDDYIALVM